MNSRYIIEQRLVGSQSSTQNKWNWSLIVLPRVFITNPAADVVTRINGEQEIRAFHCELTIVIPHCYSEGVTYGLVNSNAPN